MKTLNTVISENYLNQNSLDEIKEIVQEIAGKKGLEVIFNHQGVYFSLPCEDEEELILEAKEEIMIRLIEMGY